MSTKYYLTNNGCLFNGKNFNAWKLRIESTLIALGLNIYLDENQIKKNYENEKLKNQAIIQNAKAKSIMLNNIEDHIYSLIPNCDTPHEIMESLKVIYEEDVVFTLQEWLKKLKQLKVKDHRDALNVI
eukprot:jgi/Orpsp1_1/1181413/evm.model.c7180000077131.1